MKRCPECRRDYYDDSLLYCFEDGAALIQGSVPSPDEPATAILSADKISSEQGTRSFGQVPASSSSSSDSRPPTTSKKNSVIAGIVGVALVTALGVGSYFYYRRGSTNQVNSIAVMP